LLKESSWLALPYFGQFYAKAGERRWWREELACGHDVMLDMPNELTTLLLRKT
jgi:hypothetical protein